MVATSTALRVLDGETLSQGMARVRCGLWGHRGHTPYATALEGYAIAPLSTTVEFANVTFLNIEGC